MNTYSTACEAKGCYSGIVYQAPSFVAAIKALRKMGWSAVKRDKHGYESFCPMHRPIPVAVAK